LVNFPSTNNRFLYDGDELVAEYDSLGTLARRYGHSDNVDDPVVQYDGASEIEHLAGAGSNCSYSLSHLLHDITNMMNRR
jgi:hypothetical protein